MISNYRSYVEGGCLA